MPDEYQGEAAKAWVVLRPEGRVSVEGPRAHCRERLCALQTLGGLAPSQTALRALESHMVGLLARKDDSSDASGARSATIAGRTAPRRGL